MSSLSFEIDSSLAPSITLSLLAELMVTVKVMQQQITFLEIQATIPDNVEDDALVEVIQDRTAHQQKTADELLEAAVKQVNERIKDLSAGYQEQLKKQRNR